MKERGLGKGMGGNDGTGGGSIGSWKRTDRGGILTKRVTSLMFVVNRMRQRFISNKQERVQSTIPLEWFLIEFQSAQTSKENQHQRTPWRGAHSSVVLRMVWVTVVFINALVFALRHPRKTSTSALHGVERTPQSYCEWSGSPLSSSSCKSTKQSQ